MLFRVTGSVRHLAGAPKREGAAVVEFAILLPFLAFLFFVAIDFCRVFYFSQTLQNCAYAGALYASETAKKADSATLEDAAKEAAVLEGVTLSPPLAKAQVTYTGPNATNDITVTVTYTFTTVCNFPGIPNTVTLTRVAKMRVAPSLPGL